MAELRDLLVEMNAALPQVTEPVLLIYSRNDTGVRAEDGHADLIYAALGSAQKSLVWVEDSGHVITRDAARQTVFQAVGNFVDQIATSQAEVV
jgi:carboxylesterase